MVAARQQTETTMATIGTFTAADNGYTGSVKTLTLNVKAKFGLRRLEGICMTPLHSRNFKRQPAAPQHKPSRRLKRVGTWSDSHSRRTGEA
jgi:hypothetical protein